MKIVISNFSGEPIYEQIKAQMKSAIFTGECQEGESLPSIRGLAKDLRISVITTTRAYDELAREGFIHSVPGKGFFVNPQNNGLIREQSLRSIEENLSTAISASKIAGISANELHTMLDLLLEGDL